MRFALICMFLVNCNIALSSAVVSTGSFSKKSYIEKSPIVDDVELVQGDPFLEVFIVGKTEKGCFSEHEYHIEKLEKVTVIVPRFRTHDSEKKCETKLEPFREKAADLDVNANSTELIRVLGNFGWIERRFNRSMSPIKQE
jgi:hypothetical protein